MSYRDDRDADQARIAALEAELAASKQRVAELEGKQSQALVLAGGGALTAGSKHASALRWAGAPMHLALEHTFDSALPSEKFEDLIESIRSVTSDRGRTELMRSSFSWTASSPERGAGPFTTVIVTVKDGRTHLIVTDRLTQLAGAIFGGIGGGVGGGGVMAPIGASILMPILTPVFVIAWFGGIYGATRAIYKRAARKRAEKLQQTFNAIVAAVEEQLTRAT